MMSSTAPITTLLVRLREGDAGAFNVLFERVYAELYVVAHRHLCGRQAGHTLDTTALVHECYLKLTRQKEPEWQDRVHFFAVASCAMRQILLNYARRRQVQKRGGGCPHVSLTEVPLALEERAEMLLALDEALTALAAFDPRMAQIVELRFFGGLKEHEIATLLGLSERTVRREWRKARAWLTQTLATDARASITPGLAHAA